MTNIDRPSLAWLMQVLTLVHALLGASVVEAGRGDLLAPSSRTNSTAVRTFSFEREISWTNQDFLVRETNGKDVVQVRTQVDKPDSTAFQIIVTNPLSHNFTIGLELEPDINTNLEWCGYRQTYRTSDGIDYQFDPRGWLTDRWTIQRGGNLTEDYRWERNPMGLAGPIKDAQGRHVAHFQARTWGQGWIAMSWHSKAPHATTYTIETNDEIPIEYLAGLFTVAILRMDKCGR